MFLILVNIYYVDVNKLITFIEERIPFPSPTGRREAGPARLHAWTRRLRARLRTAIATAGSEEEPRVFIIYM